jgi:LacI family transcriptional regulator
MNVTMDDIAKEVGVSKSTISRVINNTGKVKEETRQLVLDAIKRLGYTPSSAARSLATNQTGNLGFFIKAKYFSDSDPFYSKVFTGAESEAKKHGYHMIISTIGENDNLMVNIDKVDGVILVAGMETSVINTFNAVSVPILLVDYVIEDRDIVSIMPDAFEGAYMVAKHLVELGYKAIGFVGGLPEHPSIRARYRGFVVALVEAGIGIRKEWVIRDEDFTDFDHGYSAGKKILMESERPQAIVAANDVMALGVIRACDEMSLRIPNDIAVVGYDNIEYGAYSNPPLTTVNVNKEKLGEVAVQRLLQMIDNKELVNTGERIKIGTNLVVRKSCGASM